MRGRRLLPLAGLIAFAAYLVMRLPIALDDSRKRLKHVWRDGKLDADAAFAQMRGAEYAHAIRSIREVLPADSEYLLLDVPGGVAPLVRFDLAPRRAVFGGNPRDVSVNVTSLNVAELPEWTVIPRLDPPGPRLVRTRAIAETGAVP
jgi:hypothetical protein